jgi:hypothetical protein
MEQQATKKGFKLDFTGTMVITLGLKDWPPMTINIVNNEPVVREVLRTLMENGMLNMTCAEQTALETGVLAGLIKTAEGA